MLNKRTWVLHSLLAVPLTLGLMAYTQPALAKDHTDGSAEASGGGSADGGGQASIAVRVETTVTTASGGGGGESTSSSGSTEITVHPVCWHEPDLSGVDMAKKYTDKGLPDRWDDPAVRSGAVHSFAPMYYTEHADDADGRWYKGTCDVSYAVDRQAASETVLKFMDRDIAWVWVPAGQPAPEPYIDARTLVSAAMDSVTIPAPQIDTNPKITTGDGITNATVVGMDTWIWATGDTPSQVTVTATAGSLSATVTAQASGLRINAPDSTASCTGWGTPWAEGTAEGSSDCTIEFTRSSAHLGGTTPLTTSVSYDLTWTATDSTNGTLNPITTTCTHDIPVAEIQTINRTPDQN